MACQLDTEVRLDQGHPVKMDNHNHPPYLLHDSVKHRLHQQYVDFYNKYLLNAQPSHLQPIAISRQITVPFGGSSLLPVGHQEDFSIRRQTTAGPDIRARCFVPPGEPPVTGWPVMLYIHGGGWVLGNIDSENHICTNLCIRSKCIVFTPDYRLAPEDPFPAGLDDCWETLLWICGRAASSFRLDSTRIAVGGCSSGANMAAAIVNRSLSLEPRLQLAAQLLVVPVLDNTAYPCNNASWQENEFTAALPAAKMLWYRDHYLPDIRDRSHPDASPSLFISSALSKQSQPSASCPHPSSPSSFLINIPPTTIIAGGLDILRQEAEDYGQMLRRAGVAATVHVVPGMPHPFVALDNVLDDGKRAITLLCDALTTAFARN